MPRGANPKREREYNELVKEFKDDDRYKGREKEVASRIINKQREKEVASRIINKQRKKFGETKREKAKDREGKSPDRNLAIKNYQEKTVPQVKKAMGKLSDKEIKEVKRYEEHHKDRKTLLQAIDKKLHS
jgi:hypothetical protein